MSAARWRSAYPGGPVFWTSGVSNSVTSWAEGYLSSLVNSEFMDQLSEYSTKGRSRHRCTEVLLDGGSGFRADDVAVAGQTITRGTATKASTITPTIATSDNIGDDNSAIGEELNAADAAGNIRRRPMTSRAIPTPSRRLLPLVDEYQAEGRRLCQD